MSGQTLPPHMGSDDIDCCCFCHWHQSVYSLPYEACAACAPSKVIKTIYTPEVVSAIFYARKHD